MFKTGNVIKTPYGRVEIVIGIDSKMIRTIPIDYESSISSQRLDDYIDEYQCFCCETNNNEYDPDCEDCKGTGSYTKKKIGYNSSIILAGTIKEYILKGLTKNFDW